MQLRLIGALIVTGVILVITTSCSTSVSATTGSTSDLSTGAAAHAPTEDPWSELKKKYPDAQIPQVQVVKYESLTDWPDALSQCLQSAGFSPSTTADGGVTLFVSDGQDEAYLIAQATCKIEYPLDPKYEVPLDAQQVQKLYNYYVGPLTDCLTGLGYSIPQPPSFETFAAQYGQSGAWTPYSSVTAGGDAWQNANQSCPQNPSDLYS